jgi:tetratricopeptide (TPR) repeat protein
MKKITIILLLIFQISFSQSNVEKMIDSINIEKNDIKKSKIALRIANELKFSDWKRALHYIQLAEEISKDIDNEKVIADNNFDIGNIYFDKNAQDISLDYYLKAYEYYTKHEELDRKYELENNIAIVYAIFNNKV